MTDKWKEKEKKNPLPQRPNISFLPSVMFFFLIGNRTSLLSRISIGYWLFTLKFTPRSSLPRLLTHSFCLYCSNFAMIGQGRLLSGFLPPSWWTRWNVMLFTILLGSFSWCWRKSWTKPSASSFACSGRPEKMRLSCMLWAWISKMDSFNFLVYPDSCVIPSVSCFTVSLRWWFSVVSDATCYWLNSRDFCLQMFLSVWF